MRLSQFYLGLGLVSVGAAKPAGQETYDYIVVGGGPAGIITAERLAEANKKVLLLERGQGPTVATGATNALVWNDTLTAVDIPALAPALPSGYMCTDTPGSAACVLGGGTSINFLVFVHPPAHDFATWPRGWNWKNVAPAAKRLYERNRGSTLPSADGQRYDQGLYSTLAPFFDSLGWRSVDMIEQPDEKHNIYSYPAWNIEDSKRAGPVRTYLPLAQQFPGFNLRLGTKVTRLLRSGKRVTGVEIEANGKIETIKLAARGRVVLSAGALSTPRILFHSGIGPKKQIQAAKASGVKVPAEKDWIGLPVGENLKDHPIFSIVANTNGNWGQFDTASAVNGIDEANIDLYEKSGSGVLAQGRHRLIFFTSRVGSDGVTRYFQGSCAASGNGIVTMTTYMTHGLTSTGSFGIDFNGTGVFEKPAYLQTAADNESATVFIEDMIKAITDPSTGFTLQGNTNVTSILAARRSGNHYTGTAKMGTDDGRRGGSSVVDTNTKVYGVDNLFVTDASIHPDLPTGNTQAIVMVAAEAAVAKILACKD
ncbi:cellobiose dehydrogenase [Plectosphaerella plurivora]|uniref:Cellobiose dehydrogenase n=1 Tax=Plectosphaerella plurivora TaxID=936078 RepID=A0A9P8V8J4_9PEZI|nr:cellobiose dehydrogenase [Plectosphaerella plurivora]